MKLNHQADAYQHALQQNPAFAVTWEDQPQAFRSALYYLQHNRQKYFIHVKESGIRTNSPAVVKSVFDTQAAVEIINDASKAYAQCLLNQSISAESLKQSIDEGMRKQVRTARVFAFATSITGRSVLKTPKR